MSSKPNIGIIGAGRLGTALTRLSLAHGYDVSLANAHGPESLELIKSVLYPDAHLGTVEEVIAEGDIVILAIPLSRYRTLPADAFVGKIVIDAMNYWAPTEGTIKEFADESVSSSEYVQKYLSGAKVIKTLNHVAYNELEEHSLPHGTTERRAIALAGDDAKAKAAVSTYIDDLGFDAVDLGDLAHGVAFQPDTKLFNARYTEEEMRML